MMQHKLHFLPLLNGKAPKPQKKTRRPIKTSAATKEGASGIGDDKTETQTENTFVKMNNGTLRTQDYSQSETNKQSMTNSSRILHYGTTSKQQIWYTSFLAQRPVYPWVLTALGAAPAILFFIDLIPDNLPDYLGLRTIPISSFEMFIFNFRLCHTARP